MTEALTDLDFRPLFEDAPVQFLVLRPDPPAFTVLDATGAHLRASLERVVATGASDTMAAHRRAARRISARGAVGEGATVFFTLGDAA